MRGGTETGYTIVETMIFLAITGFMFLLAAVFVSGKQQVAQFKQGMNDVNILFQQTINDVSNGFYPYQTLKCSAGSNGTVSINAGSNQQGQNIACIFLGKVIQLGTNAGNTKYNVFTVVGRQFAQNSTFIDSVSQNFIDADPKVVNGAGGGPNLTQPGNLTWGLGVRYIINDPATTHTYLDAVGFFDSFGTYTAGALASGSQDVGVVIFPSTPQPTPPVQPPSQQASTVAANIDCGLSGNGCTTQTIDSNPNILICFDGSGSEFGTLQIGNASNNVSGQKLTTNIQIYSDSTAWANAGCH